MNGQMLARDVWDLGVSMNRAYADSLRQAALDDKARQIAKLLFQAAGILTRVSYPDGESVFEDAPYPVQVHYLTLAKAAILSESELMRTRAESRALARIANQAEAEMDDGPLEPWVKELLVDACQQMPAELQRQLMADWGRR